MIQNLMIERAQIGGVRGAATVWVRRVDQGADHRGSFWFRAEHEGEMQRLVELGAAVELVGWVAGERRRLTTRLVSADATSGMAVFEGLGELTIAEEPRREVAG